MFAMAAIVLTLQEYYGGRAIYDEVIRPWLTDQETLHHHAHIKLAKYDELYGYGWWASSRVVGYVCFPSPSGSSSSRKDSLLDMGLRGRGFLEHVWIYGAVPVGRPAGDVRRLAPARFRHLLPVLQDCSSRSWSIF